MGLLIIFFIVVLYPHLMPEVCKEVAFRFNSKNQSVEAGQGDRVFVATSINLLYRIQKFIDVDLLYNGDLLADLETDLIRILSIKVIQCIHILRCTGGHDAFNRPSYHLGKIVQSLAPEEDTWPQFLGWKSRQSSLSIYRN